ncbi:MAG: hypothetical protein QW279_00395 [Candidatus Jordarchaeaceae archaeon]
MLARTKPANQPKKKGLNVTGLLKEAQTCNLSLSHAFRRRQLGGDTKRLQERRGSCPNGQVLPYEAGTEHHLVNVLDG